MVIEATELVVQRLGKQVLRSVSLRVDAGECVSIIGPNGAGKSTLMTCLLGLLPVASGRILLEGVPIREMARPIIARKIAYVPQLHEGYMGFRVSDVIESGRYAHRSALEPLGVADHEAVRTAVRETGVEPLWDRTVDTLSGGERQKVWIAAALAQSSPTLFLDEPTSALDPAHQADLIQIMRSAVRAGRTLVVICHDLNLPLALGGRVVALREGQIAFDEEVGVLRDTHRLGQLFGTRFALHQDEYHRTFSIQLDLATSA